MEDQEKVKLQKIAEMMVEEYETNNELTEFTVLDGEDFIGEISIQAQIKYRDA